MKDNRQTTPRYSRREWLKAVATLIAPTAAGVAMGTTSLGNIKASAPNAPATDAASASPKRKVCRIEALEAVGCAECDSCMPCGYGIDIPGNFKFYNEMLASGNVPDIDHSDPDSWDFGTKAKTFLRKYDRTIADEHQSQRCIKCFHCVSECRHGVFIVNELAALTRLTDFLLDWECTH